MKIALCLHGLSSGFNDFGKPIDFVIPYKNYKKNLLDFYDVDVFYHTWSNPFCEEIHSLWKPKSHIKEEQIKFDDDIYSKKDYNKTHSIKSRFYSAKKCNFLRKEYEEKNNIKYDFIFLSRFDLVMMTKFSFEEFDKDCFYIASGWGDGNACLDLWFIASPDKMDDFCSIYDDCDQYAIKTGKWCPHSFCRFKINEKNFKIMDKYEQFKDFTICRRLYEQEYSHIIDKSKVIL